MTAVELLPPGTGPHDDRWHELRRAGVTASEIAVVMGISPYGSPFSLYWQKVNDWRWEGNALTSAGQYLEPSIADWWAAQNPGRVVHSAGLYCQSERLWQLATPDRFICDPQGHDNPFPHDPGYEYDHLQDATIEALLECKWVAYSWDGWGEEGTDEVPVHYRAQALWQLDTLGVDEVHFAALGPGGFRSYLVRHTLAAEADLELMRKAAAEFMARLEAGDPPPLDSHSATLGALKKLHPSVGSGEVDVPLPLKIRYRYERNRRSEAEQEIAACEAEIRAWLGSDYGRAVCGGETVASRSVYETSRIDTKRLKAERPEIAAAYMTTTTVDRLNPGRTPE